MIRNARIMAWKISDKDQRDGRRAERPLSRRTDERTDDGLLEGFKVHSDEKVDKERERKGCTCRGIAVGNKAYA